MLFTPVRLQGAYVIDLEPHRDDRGYFARAYDTREFAEHGLTPTTAQANLSFNARAGSLRGMHFQVEPAAEAKLIRCMRGSIYDVIVDLRPDSPTYLQWFGVELTGREGRALFVPELFAHGFQTLEDETLVFYQVSEVYTPEAERGLRYDDPALGITWPRKVSAISEKDASWPHLSEMSEPTR